MPKFSIIIPVYNVAPYLRKCLDSVLAQTFTDWEAICVDDGSTDESGAILDEYAARDKRFRVIHQDNQGVNFARQKALDVSQGDWIASIDGDDWVAKDYIQNFWDVVQNDSYDMIWSDYYRDEKNTQEYKKQDFGEDPRNMQTALITESAWGALWNKCYLRNFIVRYGISFPNKARVCLCEDLCFNITFLFYKPKVKYLPKAGYHYLIRNGSAVKSDFGIEKLRSLIYVNNEILKYSIDEEVKALAKKRMVELKSYVYSMPLISNKDFYDLYPEIKSLREPSVSIWHKVLFRLSIYGFRTPVLWFICVIRKVRGIIMSK